MSDDTARTVLVDGRQMRASVRGAGPSVVLMMGGGVPGVGSWGAVEVELATSATVTTFDAAGVGGSAPPPTEPDAVGMAADVRALLAALSVSPPHILVAASYAGLVALVFAQQHPELVRGLVLLDPTSLDPMPGGRRKRAVVRLMETAARLRLLHTKPGRAALQRMLERSMGAAIDAERAQFMLERFATVDGWSSLRHVTARRAESCAQARAALTAGLPDVPLVVVSAGVWTSNPRRRPQVQLLRRSHERVAAAVPRGRHLVAENSTHWISIDDPDLVVRCVREVLAASDARSRRQ